MHLIVFLKLSALESINGSGFSPSYFLWHNIWGSSSRSGFFNCNLQQHVIEKRVKNLRISWRHQIPFTPSFASGVHSIDLDPVDNRYLLCGASRGEMSIVDLEMPLLADSRKRVEHAVIPCRPSRGQHQSFITYCQWYPQDTSLFISSDKEGKVKLWDANKSEIVDEYEFDDGITEMHWCNAVSQNPRIAVTTLASNVALIDPRQILFTFETGDSSQNLRWQNEHISSLRWSVEDENMLATGAVSGKIAIWDVRSSKNYLISATPSIKNHCYGDSKLRTCIGGIRFSQDGLFLVCLSLNHTFTILRAQTMKAINQVSLPNECNTNVASSVRFDIFSDDRVLRACTPVSDEVLVMTLDSNVKENFRVLLVGHFQRVNACIYRRKHQQVNNILSQNSVGAQVISSGNDRMIHIWSPDMDEQLPDQEYDKISTLRSDRWSDDENRPGPSYML
ncbi:unnamed protein product [Thelazia callipaeda]|uniref:WD_REPEATS_REGION domain-containing protein n=1 Tax=Thelazia callipaeda TaxID=103827 RepID=A0A0N5CVW3_THECL|nr:unnamed protein product [Thelazia callipaeda]